MEREQLVRDDFPPAEGEAGFDRASVSAHLAAVAAHVAALESMIAALEVEREALRHRIGMISPDEPATGSHPVPFTRTGPPRGRAARHGVFPEDGHHAAARFGSAGSGHQPSEPPRQPENRSEVEGAAGPARDDQEVAARLTASALALEGADRETIRARLESEYRLGDTETLLDDVLTRLG
ncbi:MAG: hypothetical protein M9938_02590 [Solirubrobacterales bacterium]|nr:hypothetical protein [Solirubrobacterales bacterium]